MTTPTVRKNPYCQVCGQPQWSWRHHPEHPSNEGNELLTHHFVPFPSGSRTWWQKYGPGVILVVVVVAIVVTALLGIYGKYVAAQ